MAYEYAGKGMTPEQADEFGTWLNAWAELYAPDHPVNESRDFRAGYEQAVTDVMRRFGLETGWGYRKIRKPSKARA